jgi:cathepsin L
VLVALCLVAVVTATWNGNLEQPQGMTYEQYVAQFGKDANAADYEVRKQLFQARVEEIIAHNADPTQTWFMGVNQFTDMPVAERRRYLGYSSTMSQTMRSTMPAAPAVNVRLEDIPASWDWRDKKVITPVKNQGGCGSCWAFAAVECIESGLIQATGTTTILSPQNMVSCTPNPQHCGGTGGCAGATSELGYQYVADKGLAAEKDYPYRAVTGTCDESKPKSAHIKGFVKLIENNYTDLIVNLATVGPIAVSVDAEPWMSYSRGVFTGCGFSRIDINHAVQAVGYGTEGGRDYWIIRNSWGGGWGESGYIRLFRHSDGDKKWCGIDPSPQDGTGCDGGPPQVTVCGSCGVWYDSSYPVGVSK